MQHHIKKFAFAKLNKILNSLECESELLKQLRALDSDLAILKHLEQTALYPRAVKFLAHGLPKREAIWWAYLASEALEKDLDDTSTQSALAVIDAWVRQPTELHRREAGTLGQTLEYYTPTSWAATAVFWSGGSITPEDRPFVEASDEMCAEAVANAIVISAHKLTNNLSDNFTRFLRQGLHIAMGGNGRII